MSSNTNRDVVLQLVHKTLNPSWQINLSKEIDWDGALDLATEHGVSALCLEAMELLPVGTVPQLQLLQWIGQTEMQRNQYDQAWKVACKLDKLWADEDIHATVMKGRSVAQYYPVPHHRYSCDLDVFIERDWEKACKLLEGKGIALEHEVYKEVEFTLDDVYVECHRYITPVRGNKKLQDFERYLRSLLHSEQQTYFDGTTLICPPLMFTVMLYIEHALGDFLHDHLTLKHVVDWVILRKQGVDRNIIELRCNEFKFDKFLSLVDALADVVEGKMNYHDLQPSYKDIFDEIFKTPEENSPRTWFRRRVNLFFNIIRNGKKYQQFGYTSMPFFLLNSVWAHFFSKEVKLE